MRFHLDGCSDPCRMEHRADRQSRRAMTSLGHVEDADVTSAPVRRVSVTYAEQYRAHAAFRARRNGIGIGAALVRSTSDESEHVWECIVIDGREWHYIRVLGPGLGQFPDIRVAEIESGIERFAGTLTAQNRIYNLLNANPLHIDRNRNVSD
jgi:hypothetical protein